MKKALIIAYNDLNNSGVPNIIYQTIKALHNEYLFDVLVFGDDTYYFERLKNDGIKINLIRFNEIKPKSKIFKLFWWLFKMPRNHYLFAKKLMLKSGYDVVHSFKELYSWPFFKAAKKVGIKKRIFHNNVDLKRNSKTKYELLDVRNLRLSIKYSTLRVGVSKLCCENAFKKHNSFVLYNCYDETKFNNDNVVQLPDNELVITQVGTFNENKNQLFSLEILKVIKEKYINAKLYLVGADDVSHYHQKLIDLVNNNDLIKNVVFIQKCKNIEKYYKNSTFAIIPSYSEGFSLVAIEAQACGLTVFASTSIPNEVNVGGVKFLDLNKGPEHWANVILETFEKQKNRRKIYDLSVFSFNRFKKELTKIYEIE